MDWNQCRFYFGMTSMKLVSSENFFISKYQNYYCFHFVSILECNANNELCLRNGTEVLQQNFYRTDLMSVVFDVIGLLALGIFMHIVAFIGIRRYVRSAGYY